MSTNNDRFQNVGLPVKGTPHFHTWVFFVLLYTEYLLSNGKDSQSKTLHYRATLSHLDEQNICAILSVTH